MKSAIPFSGGEAEAESQGDTLRERHAKGERQRRWKPTGIAIFAGKIDWIQENLKLKANFYYCFK
jgi:hypothetical protein